MITSSIAAMQKQIWQKELYRDALDNLYFTKNGMMGKGTNNVIQIKDELRKSRGDKITFSLTAKLGKTTGVAGGSELEGNESKISAYSDSISISQWRDGVRLDGLLDEQKNAYDMRQDAKNKLSVRMQEFIEMQFFLKMAGVTNPSITDIYGDTLGLLNDGSSMLTWSNTPNAVPAADSNAGYGDRYLCADYVNGATSLASTDLITPVLISRAKVKAVTAQPKILPLRMDGKNFYVMFVHPWQAFDLKNDTTYAQAQREAAERGKRNPIFTGALGVWDGVIIHEHEYIPFLDVSVAGNNFAASGSGTNFSVDTFRALLVGKQACGFAKATTKKGWVEKLFDYDDQTGCATGLIGGIQKVTFNSKDYGVVALDTAATSLV